MFQAAIAACPSPAPSAQQTDWRQIAGLYDELLRFEPTPITRANRAIAVAMAEGPAAGLRILDTLVEEPQLARWPRLRMGRGDLLARLGDGGPACAEYQAALDQTPSGPNAALFSADCPRLAGRKTDPQPSGRRIP